MPTLETATQTLREVIAETDEAAAVVADDGDGYLEEMRERVEELRFLLDFVTATKAGKGVELYDPKSIRLGIFDGVVDPDLDVKLLVGLSEAHRLAWGTQRRRSHTSHDAKTLKKMLAPESRKGEGRLPSDVAKAILGMTMERRKGDFDRSQYKDWAHVRRRFDHWLDLFAQWEERRSHRETEGAQPELEGAELPEWVRQMGAGS